MNRNFTLKRNTGEPSKSKAKLPVEEKRPIQTPTVIDNIKKVLSTTDYGHKILSIRGIEPYLQQNIIPDLIYWVRSDKYSLLDAVDKANPNNPQSILFIHKSQQDNISTMIDEEEILIGQDPEINLSGETCRKCKRQSVIRSVTQKSKGDESGDFVYKCVKCYNTWRGKIA